MRSRRFRRPMTSRLISLPSEARQFGAGRRLQIGDGGDRQKFGRRQLGSAGVAKIARTRRADRAGKARLGAQLTAAGDEDEFIGPRAQFVANVGDEIVEIAILPDQSRQRLARRRVAREAKIAASTRPIHSRHRAPSGSSASSGSNSGSCSRLFGRPMIAPHIPFLTRFLPSHFARRRYSP